MGETAAAFDGIFWIGRICDHVSSSQKFSDDRILWGTADLAGVSDLCTCHARIFLPVSGGKCIWCIVCGSAGAVAESTVHIILYCGDDPADSGKYIILQYELCSVRTTGTGKYLWLTDFQCALGIGTGMSIVWALCDFSRKMQAWWKERE